MTDGKGLKLALQRLAQMDCGDSSCLFAGRGKGGMRTNGGCRCIQKFIDEYRPQSDLEKLRDYCKKNKKANRCSDCKIFLECLEPHMWDTPAILEVLDGEK